MSAPLIRVGWALRHDDAPASPPPSTPLGRYATACAGAPRTSGGRRACPDDFKLSIKAPKDITHKARLEEADARLAVFLDEVGGLGGKLGPLLVQLPPSLTFEKVSATAFLGMLRQHAAQVNALALQAHVAGD